MQIIKQIEPNSVAQELGIRAGDYIVSIDGFAFNDFLDLVFYEQKGEFTLSVKTAEGELIDFEIELYEDESLGIVVDDNFKIRACCNNCIFCFVNQLPCVKNLRPSLKIKDDDWRMSVIYGNYVTLTNLKKGELERIIRLKMSPLYVSVHATNANLRQRLLGTKQNADIMPILKTLKNAGIVIHAQVVACPQINDGAELDKTLLDLAPVCQSLAVVPVGLTKDANPQLKPMDKESAERIINSVEAFSDNEYQKNGRRFCYCADEMYLIAQRQVKDADYYEDFCQIENGVGMIAKMRAEVAEALEDSSLRIEGEVSLVTGVAAKEVLEELCASIGQKLGLKINVFAIKNDFFGHSVNVAGLVTGGDIINQLKGKNLGKALLIPRHMLKEFETVFLDNTTTQEVEERLKTRIIIVENNGGALVGAANRI